MKQELDIIRSTVYRIEKPELPLEYCTFFNVFTGLYCYCQYNPNNRSMVAIITPQYWGKEKEKKND